MKIKTLVASLALTATVVSPAYATFNKQPKLFEHVGTFDVTQNPGSEVAEIVDATKDGKTLVYADADGQLIGFVDIANPADPQPAGVFDELGGEPTSVAIKGRYALVGVNTSTTKEIPCLDNEGEEDDAEFITDWSGKLVVVDIQNIGNPKWVMDIDLGGQPDSVAVSPNGHFAAIAIENERNEDVGGGLIPQGSMTLENDNCDSLVAIGDPKPGKLVIVDLKGKPSKWKTRDVELTGLRGMFASEDPEPEFVDINHRNLAAVTLQENNHIAIVDLRRGKVVKHFSAGEVRLRNVDIVEDDLITLNSEITKRREPDAVAWTSLFDLATANEGDYEDKHGEEGGSRGFTIFDKRGGVKYETAESFEHVLVSAGHYNEGRSENKGVEPEGVEYARFGRDRLLFGGSERSNAVGVYKLSYFKEPQLIQVLPTGIGPEGLKAIPNRNLFVASAEVSLAEDEVGIPSMITIYQRSRGAGNYPQIISGNDSAGLPIPWVALSGLVGDPDDPHTLYAVSDSFLAKGFIYTIDVSDKPALITERLEVNTELPLDLEGIAVGPDGHFWLGSEGNSGSRENLVLKVDSNTGNVINIYELPVELVDNRRGNGIEGIAVKEEEGGLIVYVAIQREWPNEGDPNPDVTDELTTKIGRLDVESGSWTFINYPLEKQGNGDWIGLSELTLLPDGDFAVIERDKGWGPSTPPNAELKAVFKVDLTGAADDGWFTEYKNEESLPNTLEKTCVANLVETIAENSVWIAEKLEGLAVTAINEQVYAVVDNDGVDDATGETVFLHLGGFSSFGDSCN
jgi:hypothetical protein